MKKIRDIENKDKYSYNSTDIKTYRIIENYKFVNNLNAPTSLIINSEFDNRYYLLGSLLPNLDNSNFPSVPVAVPIKTYKIDFSNGISRGFWLEDFDNILYKLTGNSDSSYESFLPEFNYMFIGITSIYDSFKDFGILTTSLNKYTKSELELIIQHYELIKYIHNMTVKSNTVDNTFIENFSLDFISKNYEFIISQLHVYIIPEIVEFMSNIMKEYSINHNVDFIDHSINMKNEENAICMPTKILFKRDDPIPNENEIQFSNIVSEFNLKNDIIKNEEIESSSIISVSSPTVEECNQNNNGTQSLLELLSQQLEEQQDSLFLSTDDTEKNNPDYFTCKLCPFPALNSITVAENRNETYAYCQSKYDIHCLTKKHKDSILKASVEDIASLPPCRVLKTFLCEVCDYETWIKEKFIDHCKSASHRLTPGHTSTYSKQAAAYRCLPCKFNSEDINLLEKHLNCNVHLLNLTDRMQKVIHPDQERDKIETDNLKGAFNFKCKLCNFKGTNIYKFDVHCSTKKHLDNLSKATIDERAVLQASRTLKTFLCVACEYETWVKEMFHDHCNSTIHIDNLISYEQEHQVNNSCEINQIAVYRCHPCKFNTEEKFELEEHLKTDFHNTMTQSDEDYHGNIEVDKKHTSTKVQANKGTGNYVCKLCNYQASESHSFDAHCMSKGHKRAIAKATVDELATIPACKRFRTFLCEPCAYETVNNQNFIRHCLTEKHKTMPGSDATNPKQVSLFRCNICKYASELKINLHDHIQKNIHLKNPPNAYQSYANDSYNNQDANFYSSDDNDEQEEEIDAENNHYSCKLCLFESANADAYAKHCKTKLHKKAVAAQEEVESKNVSSYSMKTFFCQICNYETTNMTTFNEHCNNLKHFSIPDSIDPYSNQDQIPMYRCKQCSFITDSLKLWDNHNHSSNSNSYENEKEKINLNKGSLYCKICSFQATSALKFSVHCSGNAHKQATNRFFLKQGQNDNIPKPNKYSNKPGQEVPSFCVVKTYLCEACRYETNNNPNFVRHCKNTKHKSMPGNELINPNQPALYRCSACSFSTNVNRFLECHILTHTSLSSSSFIVQNDVSKVVEKDNIDDDLGFDIDSFNEKKNYRTKFIDKKADSSRPSSRKNSYVDPVDDVIMKEDNISDHDDDNDDDDDNDHDDDDDDYDDYDDDNADKIVNNIDIATSINNEEDNEDEEYNYNVSRHHSSRKRRNIVIKDKILSKVFTTVEEKSKEPKVCQLSQMNAYVDQAGKIVTENTDTFQLTFQTEMQDGYKRNNKANGTKNIRCFPNCGLVHKEMNFCGASIKANVRIDKRKINYQPDSKIIVVGEIRPTADADSTWLYPGTAIDYKDLAIECRPEFSRYFSDQVIISNEYQEYISIDLEFNSTPKCWQYSWIGGRWQTDSTHAFFVTILLSPNSVNAQFEQYQVQKLNSIAQLISSPFAIHCARRSQALSKEYSRKKTKKSSKVSLKRKLDNPDYKKSINVNDEDEDDYSSIHSGNSEIIGSINIVASYRCGVCKFVTDEKKLLEEHLLRRNHTTKEINELIDNHVMITNEIINDNALEFEKDNYVQAQKNFVCYLCSYETSIVRSFDAHCTTKGHKEAIANATPEEISLLPTFRIMKSFLCEDCDFETINKRRFTIHCDTNNHKKLCSFPPNQFALYRCTKCKFVSSKRTILNDHNRLNIHLITNIDNKADRIETVYSDDDDGEEINEEYEYNEDENYYRKKLKRDNIKLCIEINKGPIEAINKSIETKEFNPLALFEYASSLLEEIEDKIN